MKYPTLRVVFDRKHETEKGKKGLVQIEVLYERSRKYFSANVKVYKKDWNEKKSVVRNTLDCDELNDRIKTTFTDIQKYINELILKKIPFTFEGLYKHKEEYGNSNNFIDFVIKRIKERKDIRETTRKAHRLILTDLKDFGEIVTFGDLTKANIAKFDDYLHNKGLMQTSIYGRHKLLKNYINEAIRYEYIENSPYEGMRIEHGRTEGIKYLLKSEIDKIEKCKIQDTSISNARDVFIFQCYTGLSYSDLSKFKWDKVKKEGSDYIIRDVRKKTSEEYFIVLLKPAIRILIKHDFKLPLLSNQKYNEYLKLVAKYAKIDKCITSHYSRHSFAVMMLSMGVSMTNLSKMMGHSSTRITESTYAKVLATDLKRDYDMINQKLK